MAFFKRTLALLLLLILVLFTSSFILAQEEESHTVGLELVVEGLTSPVVLTSAGDDSGRLFIVDQAGTIRILDEQGQLLEQAFLDLTTQMVPLMPDYDERGVLGLAFHPDYANNGRFFVYYTGPLMDDAPAGWDHSNIVAEFTVSADDPNLADLGTQRIILRINQPQFNHDAGQITFGPDGYLYVPIGDGGGGNDTDVGHTPEIGNAQDLSNLHGSILRLDVDGDFPYVIPSDNPFVGDDGMADEIYAYGLRNPFGLFFDTGGNNELYVADAGQELYEEIDVITAGGNYGWNIKEGLHCFDPDNPEQAPESCETTGANGEALIDPIIEYGHDKGIVVVGGIVYRGSAIPDLEGHLIFGSYAESFDSSEGLLFTAEGSGEMWTMSDLQVAGNEGNGIGAYLLSLGRDDAGEIYLLTTQNFGPTGETGKVWRMVPSDQDSTTMTESDQPEMTEEAEAMPTTEAADQTEPTAEPAGDDDAVEPQTTEEASG